MIVPFTDDNEAQVEVVRDGDDITVTIYTSDGSTEIEMHDAERIEVEFQASVHGENGRAYSAIDYVRWNRFLNGEVNLRDD